MTTMTLTCDRSMLGEPADERRETRLERRQVVRLFEPFSGRFLAAETCNVSSAGVCLELHADAGLRAGRFVTLHGTPATGPRRVESVGRPMTARVVWARRDADDPARLRVGLQLYAAPVAAAA